MRKSTIPRKKSKRGIALEMSIATMLIIFALCLVLLTVAELAGFFNKKSTESFNTKTEIDRIGDDFILWCADFYPIFDTFDYPEIYTIIIDSVNKTLRVDSTATGKNLLFVQSNSSGEVLAWNYDFAAIAEQ